MMTRCLAGDFPLVVARRCTP